MLRIVVALLLVANALLLAWQMGLLGVAAGTPEQGQREPERLQRQVNADQVRVLSPVAASAALADAARASADGASQAAPAAAEAGASAAGGTPAAAASSVVGTSCLEAGPFAAAELSAAEKVLRDAALPAGSWTSVSTPRKGSYMIYMGRFADDEALARKQDELKRLKVEAQAMANWPDLQPGLVLARFDEKAAADAALAALVQRGVRTGRVVTVAPPVTLASLRVSAADAEQRARLAKLKLPPGQQAFVPCGSAKS